MSSSSDARQRITALLDENSFVEIGAAVRARSTDFGVSAQAAPSDGVITGYGVIDGSLVYVYSQDASVLGGSIGEMHARKITALYDMAIRMGAPVIGLLDSAGMRLEEGVDALEAFAAIYGRQAKASGVVPQITAVFGRCGGGLAVACAMSDFTLMEEGAHLFVNAPNALAGNKEDKDDTSSAEARKAYGNADFVGTQEEVLAQIRELVSVLPSNNEDDAESECADDINRDCPGAAALYRDPAALLTEVADNGQFIEKCPGYAPEMAAGLVKLGGWTAGVIANRSVKFDENGEESETYGEALTAGGAYKAADFVRFCDAFEIPVITLTNVCGFAATKDEERKIADAAAKLASALCSATVPKINVITGKAVGSAYGIMGAGKTGTDLTIAFPDAEIGIMDAKLAAKIIAADEGAAEQAETARKYAELQSGAQSAAARGYVDCIIEPASLRKYLIGALEMLYTKREELPSRKHSAK